MTKEVPLCVFCAQPLPNRYRKTCNDSCLSAFRTRVAKKVRLLNPLGGNPTGRFRNRGARRTEVAHG